MTLRKECHSRCTGQDKYVTVCGQALSGEAVRWWFYSQTRNGGSIRRSNLVWFLHDDVCTSFLGV